MDVSKLRLKDFSQLGLNLLGRVFADGDARIVVSERAKYPMTVALENRTVILDPQRTGIFDLAIGARLLKHRAMRREGPTRERHKDAWLTKMARLELAKLARADLLRRYPGLHQLWGRYHSPNETDYSGLRMVVKSVSWTRLPDITQQSSNRKLAIDFNSNTAFRVIPELEITDAGNDLQWLIQAIAAGRIPLQTIPTLEDLPYIRIPYRICAGDIDPKIEEMERILADPENMDMVASLIRCYRQKSEVRDERLHLGRHQHAGIHLDSGRLVDAVIAQRVGLEPKMFRRKSSIIEPIFDSREHVAVVAVDLNDLRKSSFDYWNDPRARVLRFVLCMFSVFQKLEIDCAIIGIADQLVEIENLQTVCLHFVTTLKQADEPIDSSFWARFHHLMDHPPEFPGEPTCFHALGINELRDQFDAIAKVQDHSYRSQLWWARRGLKDPRLDHPGFLTRMADYIDTQVRDMERRFTGTFDTLPTFVPESLKNAGQPGGFLAGVRV